MALITVSPQASAAIVYSTGTITVMNVYPDFGSGDVIFMLSSQVAGCEHGFWLSPSQPGFKQSYAFISQARANGESITAGGDNAMLWSGSSGHYCKLYWVSVP